VLPLLHWLPLRFYRAALDRIGKGFFASEDNLNLLSRRALAELVSAAGITNQELGSIALCGWPTNLILTARKPAA